MAKQIVLAPDKLALVKAAQRKFSTIAKRGGGVVNWPTESQFAQQALARNSFLASCVPQTITDAIISVAAIGLSLNPQRKHCALIPRYDTNVGAYVCCADPMYQGLISLATESESILAINCDVVREEDVHEGNFTYVAGSNPHVHFSPNPFHSPEQRGKIIGCFCVTQIAGTPFPQTTWMRIEEIYAIRDKYSEAWKNKLKKERENPGKYFYGGPWEDADAEMIKKTVIKRAAKLWPKRTERLDRAIAMSDEAEGYRIEPRDSDIEGEVVVEKATKTQVAELTKLIAESHVPPEKVLKRFKIDKLEDMPRNEVVRCEQLLKESKLIYILRHATPETQVYAADYGISLDALEGKAANEQSKAKLFSKRTEETTNG